MYPIGWSRIEEGLLVEGVAGGQAADGVDHRQARADADQKEAMRDGPEILRLVPGVPGGASQDLAAGKLDQQRSDEAVFLLRGAVVDAGDEAVRVEGEQDVEASTKLRV